jgi:hypothetical protein
MPNGAPDNGKWVKLITQLGIPTVLAGVLLWFIMTRMMAVFDRITQEMDAQTAALQRLEARLDGRHHAPPPGP